VQQKVQDNGKMPLPQKIHLEPGQRCTPKRH
jgi:hypothetical protein